MIYMEGLHIRIDGLITRGERSRDIKLIPTSFPGFLIFHSTEKKLAEIRENERAW